jgi:hypothetical protein
MPYKETAKLWMSSDYPLAGSLISSPVWASWLSGFNEFLSSLTLILGVILGVYRFYCIWKDRQGKAKNGK